MLYSFVTTAHLIICFLLIFAVLLQQGKGADVGATFGGGGNTLFGASGADSLLSRVTKVAALMFMGTSLYLAVAQQTRAAHEGTLFQDAPAATPAPVEVPAAGTTPISPSSETPAPTNPENSATAKKNEQSALQQSDATAESDVPTTPALPTSSPESLPTDPK